MASNAWFAFLLYAYNKSSIIPAKSISTKANIAPFLSTGNVKKEELIKATNVAKEFTFEEIKTVTNNFSEILGQGGFGSVYKGYLLAGLDVAIKILSHASEQGPQEFLNEVFNVC